MRQVTCDNCGDRMMVDVSFPDNHVFLCKHCANEYKILNGDFDV